MKRRILSLLLVLTLLLALPVAGSAEATAETPLTITVNESTLPTVALTSVGYAYGKPVSGFQLTTPTGVQIGRKQIRDANDAEVTDGTFGAQAYTLWVNLECEEGYKLSEKTAVTLDGKEPLRVEGDFYVFELEELYPTYTITYNNLDGVTLSNAPASYNKYSGTVTIPNPTKDGYRFLGWTGEGITEPQKDVSFEAKEMNRNLTYTAKWDEIIYRNVDFVTEHGAKPQAQRVESGTKAARPADPTEDGWKFKSWHRNNDYMDAPFDFDTPITENITLYAKWAKTWTVTFDSNGHGTAPAVQTVEEGENAAKPTDPTDGDYSFQGWYTTAECSTTFDFSTPITGDTTVYAKWVKKPIVSFNRNGHGTAPASQTVELNGKATKPADPTAEGYVFRGWYTTAACTTEFDFNTPITADTTLYAKWNETYTVTFNVGRHGTAPTAQTVENGGKATKPENPTAKGWRFDGWYTDERCTAGYDFDKAVTANTTLYAKWTQLFTLTFETNGGTKIDSVEAPDGSLVYLGSYKPTKSGYYFVGWYTDKNLTRESRVGYVRMDGNKTVYAKFAVADKTNPKTADPALPGLALAVLSFSAVGLAALGIQKRK